MIRIAITTAAYDASCATLPLGSVAVEPYFNDRGERLIWLEDGVLRERHTDQFCSDTRRAFLAPLGGCDPQDHLAVALVRPPHRPEPIRHRVLKPDQALAVLVGLGFDGHAAERERGADRVVRGGGDGDADHALTATFRYFVGFHTLAIRCASDGFSVPNAPVSVRVERKRERARYKDRDTVAAKMTPAQIAEAQRLASEWKPTK